MSVFDLPMIHSIHGFCERNAIEWQDFFKHPLKVFSKFKNTKTKQISQNYFPDNSAIEEDFFSKNKTVAEENFSQNDFLNAIIHELKTPLNAIIGFSDVIDQEIKTSKSLENCADYAEEIKKAADDLNDLIHDLLEVNSNSSGNFSIDLSKEIDVRDLLKRSIRLNYDFALGKQISLKSEITDDISTINLDMKRMKQIMANLISNAIKYSPKKTEIKISIKNVFYNKKKHLEIRVSDQGFGMSPQEIDLAFKKYETVTNPNSKKVDSFGLGLPITKKLVELQKGMIEISSELKKGTEMILRFPYLA
jgi:signal transduction histidine kinase